MALKEIVFANKNTVCYKKLDTDKQIFITDPTDLSIVGMIVCINDWYYPMIGTTQTIFGNIKAVSGFRDLENCIRETNENGFVCKGYEKKEQGWFSPNQIMWGTDLSPQ